MLDAAEVTLLLTQLLSHVFSRNLEHTNPILIYEITCGNHKMLIE